MKNAIDDRFYCFCILNMTQVFFWNEIKHLLEVNHLEGYIIWMLQSSK